MSENPKRAAAVFFFSLFFTVPIAVIGTFDKFVPGKSVPEWLAEKGWPGKAGMLKLALTWLAISLTVSFAFYGLLILLARPKLKGKIVCIDVNPHVTQKFAETVCDCFLILTLTLRGKNAIPTMLNRWELELLWEGEAHPGTHEDLDGYGITHEYAHPVDGKTEYEKKWTPFIEFPTNEEITQTNYVTGSVRFCVKSLPLEAVEGEHLKREVRLKLWALDNQDRPHLIYKKAAGGLAGCGKVEKKPKRKVLYA